VDEMETQPLPALTGNSLQALLDAYRLNWLTVAQASQVPITTIWRITRGLPVTREHARLVRHGLQRLIGSSYTARITVLEPITR
jgi:hypothetical protein